MLTMWIQKVIHVHIQSQQKRVEVSGIRKRLIKTLDIKQLVIIFTEGGKHKIIIQTIS